MAKPRATEKSKAAHYHCVFLQPHRDDTCFSLGAFAAGQRGSLMITICTVSSWVHPEAVRVRLSQQDVTALRRAEDKAFADDAGLALQDLGLLEAPLLGWSPWDLSRTKDNQRRVEGPLMAALARIAQAQPAGDRPWLFCPAGIGGHIDHLAVRNTLLLHWAQLAQQFRIAFYEDLHYASRFRTRRDGLAGLFSATRGRNLSRWVHLLDDGSITRKCGLIAHYGSQIARAPADLCDYSPSTFPRSAPHEAIWTVEQPPDGFKAAPWFETGEFLAKRRARSTRKSES